MSSDAETDHLLTRAFFEALHPLLQRLSAKRTLSTGKLGVLRHLAEHGRATTTELAVVVQVSPQAISLSARELERLQLVVRVPDAEDRRRSWIELTDAGRQKLAEESGTVHDWITRSMAERLTAEERETLRAVIPVLRKLGSETSVD